MPGSHEYQVGTHALLGDFVLKTAPVLAHRGAWFHPRTMVKSDLNPQERIAREILTQRPLFLGADGENAAHYWDGYERAAVVVPEDAETTDDVDRFYLADTPLTSLRGWAEHVRNKRGWETGPRICSSIIDQLADRVEAAQ